MEVVNKEALIVKHTIVKWSKWITYSKFFYGMCWSI